MAFEKDLGYDGSQPIDQEYTLSAYDIITRTLSLLKSKFVQYIVIVGIVGAACIIFSAVIYFAIFGIIGVFASDPINYLISALLLETPTDMVVVGVSLGFGIFAFILTAITGGAAIKFTLDEYGGIKGDIGNSFSHSFSRLLPLIIYQLFTAAMIAVVITPFTFLSLQMVDMIDITDPLNFTFPPGFLEAMMQAMLIFLVGGIILFYISIRLAPTLAVIMDTDLSVIDSLKKSWELTSGNFMHIFGAMILIAVVNFIIAFILGMITGITFLSSELLLVVDSTIIIALFGALTYIFGVVLYKDLASRKGASTLPGFVS